MKLVNGYSLIRVDVTDQHKITISEDGQSFVIDLGDITEQDQYRIAYNVHLNYDTCRWRNFEKRSNS